MSFFDWLLVGHLIGDFLLQTDNMARFKAERWSWMLRHVGLYVGVIAIPVGAYAVNHPVPLWVIAVLLLFIGATHVILDRRSFAQWWMQLIGISADREWLSIVVDQVFHLLVLALVAQTLIMVSG